MGALTEIYVDPAIAADSGTGTIGDPYGDLQYALNTATRDATNGNRINIKAGTAEVLTGTISYVTYGTPGLTAPLIFQGYTSAAGDGGIGDINGNTLDANMFAEKNFVCFKDLIIRGAGSGQCIRSTNGVIENCEIHTCTNYAVVLINDSHVYGCNIYNTSNGIYLGVRCSAAYNFLQNATNDFTYAIRINDGDSYAWNNIISIDGASIGISIVNAGASVCHNSILSSSGTGSGIVTSNTQIILVSNNLVEGFSGAGGDGIISAGAGEDMPLLMHNAVYNCTTAYAPIDQNIIAADNETLGATPFAKSGANTYANRAIYFAPVVTGNVQGGAYPTALRLDKGAVQHADPAAGGLIRHPGMTGGLNG